MEGRGQATSTATLGPLGRVAEWIIQQIMKTRDLHRVALPDSVPSAEAAFASAELEAPCINFREISNFPSHSFTKIKKFN